MRCRSIAFNGYGSPGSPLFGPQCDGNTWSNNVQQCPTIPMVMSRSLGTCDGTFANTPNVPCPCIRPGCWLRSEPPSGSWQREEQRLDKVDRCFFFISPMHRDLWIQREIKHKKDCGTWWKLQWGSRWFYKHWSVGILIRFFGYIIYIYIRVYLNNFLPWPSNAGWRESAKTICCCGKAAAKHPVHLHYFHTLWESKTTGT